MRIRFLCLIILAAGLWSCEKNDNKIIRDEESVNEWVYNNMDKYYLWNSFMPGKEQTSQSQSVQGYFEKLRYRDNSAVALKDDIYGDRFSDIEKKSGAKTRAATLAAEYAGEERVDDFGMFVGSVVNGDVLHHSLVLYVVPGSPAAKAGVKRGDCFRKMDGEEMAIAYQNLIKGKNRIQIEFFYPRSYTVTLDRQNMLNYPVVFDTIYRNYGPKTGYLVYNQFLEGEKGSFNNDLKHIFGNFKNEGVKHLILDLRYNGGGELTTARLLGSFIARKRDLGKVMIYTERNDSYGNPDKFTSEMFMKEDEAGAYNPDFESVCILTSDRTASASELIIHSLKPYFGTDLHVIGQTTYGKNIGGITIDNKKYEWEISVMTLRVYNSNKVSGYESGIVEDHTLKEHYRSPVNPDAVTVGRWGEPENELLVRKAMSIIYPGAFPARYGMETQSEAYRVEAPVKERGLVEGRYIIE